MIIAIKDFEKYISELNKNTVDNPYIIELDLRDKKDFKSLNTILKDNKNENKYVHLDLSNSIIDHIPDYAFYHITTLTGVTLPKRLTSIGKLTFCSTSISVITIPDSVTKIGASAFASCSKLIKINLPNSLTKIEGLVFDQCTGLVNITIPESVTIIERFSFWNCSNLTNITIPKNVTIIEATAFSNCTNLTAINVDSENKTYSSMDGVLYNKDKTVLFWYPEGKKGSSFTVPATVIKIGYKAFYHCINLYEIIMQEGVLTIENNAFLDCSNLIRIIIPNSLTSIGSLAFNECTSLDFASLNIPDNIRIFR